MSVISFPAPRDSIPRHYSSATCVSPFFSRMHSRRSYNILLLLYARYFVLSLYLKFKVNCESISTPSHPRTVRRFFLFRLIRLSIRVCQLMFRSRSERKKSSTFNENPLDFALWLTASLDTRVSLRKAQKCYNSFISFFSSVRFAAALFIPYNWPFVVTIFSPHSRAGAMPMQARDSRSMSKKW